METTRKKLRKLTSVLVASAIIIFFGNAGIQIFKDGFYTFSITVFGFGLFSALIAYFTIQGKDNNGRR